MNQSNGGRANIRRYLDATRTILTILDRRVADRAQDDRLREELLAVAADLGFSLPELELIAEMAFALLDEAQE